MTFFKPLNPDFASTWFSAARSEYWYFMLFLFVIGLVASIIDSAAFPASIWPPLNTAFNLAVFLPVLAISARRLHDINTTGWFVLLVITVLGIFILLALAA